MNTTSDILLIDGFRGSSNYGSSHVTVTETGDDDDDMLEFNVDFGEMT